MPELIEQVAERALSVPDQARSFTISTADDYQRADGLLTGWREIEAQVHAAFDSVVDAAHKAHKEAVAQRKKYLDPLEQGRSLLKPKMAKWNWEQERIRLEAQRKAEEEARKREEEERLAAAVALEQAGEPEAAEEVLSAPAVPAPVFVPKAIPKTDTKFRMQWYAEVVSLRALCKAVAEGKVPETLIEANMPALNKMASALKQSMSVPGVAAKSRTV